MTLTAIHYGGGISATDYGGSIAYAPNITAAPDGEVDGQLYDSETGRLLYDAVTGRPLVW